MVTLKPEIPYSKSALNKGVSLRLLIEHRTFKNVGLALTVGSTFALAVLLKSRRELSMCSSVIFMCFQRIILEP